MEATIKYVEVSVDELKPYLVRDIRENVVEKLKERIKHGYNPSKPLSIIKIDDCYHVADGNHRLEAIKKLGIEKVPCLIYENDDPIKIATKCNQDEDTYAPMDLFDWLDVIGKLKADGLTQVQIGEKIGWKRESVSKYNNLSDKLGTEVLKIARSSHTGRVPENGTNVPKFDFSEGWFRDSKLYDLYVAPLSDDEKAGLSDYERSLLLDYQKCFMDWFVAEKFRPTKNQQKDIVDNLIKCKTQIEYIKDQVKYDSLDEDLKKEIDDVIINVKNFEKPVYKSLDRIKKVVDNIVSRASNQAIYGVDALDYLKTVEPGKIDCVVTDVPWGVEFTARRDHDRPEFDGDINETIKMLDPIFNEVKRVCKNDAHLYIFFPIAYHNEFLKMLSKYFIVDPIPIIWVKNNHAPRDFKKGPARKYEPIFFCKMPDGDKRSLNYDITLNVQEFDLPKHKDRIHDTQKPVELLEYLIKDSTGDNEYVLDPFAGSGSTLIAALKAGRYYMGVEKEKSYEVGFKEMLEEVGSNSNKL